MNTAEKYAPSFYGKDADKKLNTWNNLFSTNDFAVLITSQKSYLVDYVANLRKAEIFKQCAHAAAELDRLRSFISWEEDYSLNYNVYTTLPFYCETLDEFVAHANKTSDITSDWVVSEFHSWDGDNSLEWELYEGSDEITPGEIHVYSLRLVGIETV